MTLKEYFDTHKGTGLLATADDKGIVNAAIYATPHFMEDGQIAFIMRERHTHENITKNPHACYVFTETGKMEGKRLYLTRVKEEVNSELLFSLRRRCPRDKDQNENLYLVFFTIDKELPLVGQGESW